MKSLTSLLAVIAATVCFAGNEGNPHICTAQLPPNIEVTLEGTTFWNGDFPALNVHVKVDGADEGHMVVRFPEQLEATHVNSGVYKMYYQDNRLPEWPADLACEPLKVPVKWMGDDKELSYTMEFENGMVLKAKAKVVGTRVVMTHKLTNGSDSDLSGIKFINCVVTGLCTDILDQKMRRTAVPVDGKFQLMRDMVPEFYEYEDDRLELPHFYRSYMVDAKRMFTENPQTFPHPGHPDDPKMALTNWQVVPSIDAAIVATGSKDGIWGIATLSRMADNAWSNAANTCQHADPVIESCKIGETITSINQIYVFSGPVEKLSVKAFPFVQNHTCE